MIICFIFSISCRLTRYPEHGHFPISVVSPQAKHPLLYPLAFEHSLYHLLFYNVHYVFAFIGIPLLQPLAFEFIAHISSNIWVSYTVELGVRILEDVADSKVYNKLLNCRPVFVQDILTCIDIKCVSCTERQRGSGKICWCCGSKR